MDSESPLTLDHDIPDPETYLPGTPTWVWWSVAGAVITTLILLYFLIRHFSRNKTSPPPVPRQDFYKAASQSLSELEADCDTHPLAEIAAHSSLAIRIYLAGSMREPALYETVEEFKARQPNLPPEAETLLGDLNDAKYSKSTIDAERARDFLTRSKLCLDTIHAAHTLTA